MNEQLRGPQILEPMHHDPARQALLNVRNEVAKAVVGQEEKAIAKLH